MPLPTGSKFTNIEEIISVIKTNWQQLSKVLDPVVLTNVIGNSTSSTYADSTCEAARSRLSTLDIAADVRLKNNWNR